jgi:hypothetical protein
MGDPLSAHHANAFYIEPDRCFRFVCRTGGGRGQPYHCPAPVAWRGVFVTPLGKPHRVWSCEGHRDALTALRPA